MATDLPQITNPAELRRIDDLLDTAIRKALKTMPGDRLACAKVAQMLGLFAATLAQEGGLSLEQWRAACAEAEVMVTERLDMDRAEGARQPLRNRWSVGSHNA